MKKKKKKEYPDKIRVRASIGKGYLFERILDNMKDHSCDSDTDWFENEDGFEFRLTQTWSIDRCFDEFDEMIYEYGDRAYNESYYDFVDYTSKKFENDKFVVEFEIEKFREPDDDEYMGLFENGRTEFVTGIVFELIES